MPKFEVAVSVTAYTAELVEAEGKEQAEAAVRGSMDALLSSLDPYFEALGLAVSDELDIAYIEEVEGW